LALCLLAILAIRAEADVRITLKNGRTLSGALIGRTKKDVMIRSEGQLKNIDLSEVSSMEVYLFSMEDAMPIPSDTTPERPLSASSAELLRRLDEPIIQVTSPYDIGDSTGVLVLTEMPENIVLRYKGNDLLNPAGTVEDATLQQATEADSDFIVLNNGQSISGKIILELDSSIVIRLKSGRISIPRSQIKTIARNTAAID